MGDGRATRRSSLAAVLLLLALIPLAACGAAGNGVKSTPELRVAELYRAARAEGQVTLYSSMAVDDAKRILSIFEGRYPGVKVDLVRAQPDSLVARIVAEKKAGQDLFDMLETTSQAVKFLIDQRYTQRYRVQAWADFPQAVKDDTGGWLADRLSNYFPSVNTTKVPAGAIKTWRDLCDKRYEGHIAVEMWGVSIYTALRRILGEAEAQELLQCVAANKPILRTGHPDIANRLAKGEFWVTFASIGHRIAELKYQENAPVDWVRTDPIITDMQLVALANRPPHPNAARLLMEWLTSPSGQQTIADTGRVPASNRAQLKYPDLEASGKIFFITPDLEADYDTDSAFWRSTFGIH
jgi:iron(III) transport system substrate-binding protein